jgi:ATP-binding cassette, subfamily G (WHITE), member 2, PDR
LSSPERAQAMNEIEAFHTRLENVQSAAVNQQDKGEFAMPFRTQLKAVTIRTFQHYYRSPVYIGGKFILNVLASLFIGFTFYMEDDSVQGFQNKLFAVFFTVSRPGIGN